MAGTLIRVRFKECFQPRHTAPISVEAQAGETDMKYVMIAVIAVAGLAGCETVQGAGKDMQSAGRAVESAAE